MKKTAAQCFEDDHGQDLSCIVKKEDPTIFVLTPLVTTAFA